MYMHNAKRVSSIQHRMRMHQMSPKPVCAIIFTVQLNFRMLACEIVHTLHKQQNIHCVLACALEVDDISTANEEYKCSLQV